jgi:hypothetical protein
MKLIAALVGTLLATAGAAHALPKLGGDEAAPAAAPAPLPAPAPATRAPVPLDRVLDEAPAAGSGGEKYVGVIPGPNSRNPLPPAKKAPPHLIWSGFKGGDGSGSQVFFQTNLPVTFEVVPSAGNPRELSVFLRNCRIHMRNNQRNLDTRFFATPVQGVSARQRRKDVELRIVLKEPSSPTPRTEPGPDGTHFVVLEFPPGQPAAVETATPADTQ